MKQFLFVLATIVFLFVQDGTAQNRQVESKPNEVKYQQFDSYFEKNNSGLKGDFSYLVIKNQKDFDKVFGVAATMGENHFLPDKVFDSMFVVATIKHRSSLRTYEVTQTATVNGNLYVRYNTVDKEPSSATFSSPLILAVPKGNYKKVVFVENGKEVKSIAVKK